MQYVLQCLLSITTPQISILGVEDPCGRSSSHSVYFPLHTLAFQVEGPEIRIGNQIFEIHILRVMTLYAGVPSVSLAWLWLHVNQMHEIPRVSKLSVPLALGCRWAVDSQRSTPMRIILNTTFRYKTRN